MGRTKAGALTELISEYETRASRYWPLEVVDVKEERGGRSITPNTVMRREGERILAHLRGIDFIVACHPQRSKALNSEEFSRWLLDRREAAQSVGFAIGGAFGLSGEVLAAAHLKLSVAPWTLTHELARLILAEQLYRAGTIVRGEPYHK